MGALIGGGYCTLDDEVLDGSAEHGEDRGRYRDLVSVAVKRSGKADFYIHLFAVFNLLFDIFYR